MTPRVVTPRATVLALAAVLAGVAVALGLWWALGGGAGRTVYHARFTNARGLIAGNDVRVGGAIAGRVIAVKLARDGAADVRFTLDDDRAAPRADAVAAIRPVDLLGDNYLSLSPGGSRAPLQGAIATSHTLNAPRLDEVLRAFGPPAREGLRSLLVDAGLALDRRGADVARAAVGVRPVLRAADGVLREVEGQNGALDRLVPSAARAATQLASGSGDLGPLLDGLARTVTATAAHGDDLGTGVHELAATLRRLRTTARRLSATAGAATPLSADLRDAAPALARGVRGLQPLLTEVRAATTGLRPAIRTADGLLTRGAPTLASLDGGLRSLRATAPDAATFTDAIAAAAPNIAQGFLVAFPDEGAESGRQPFDPFADPRRGYWRGAAVFSCEAFGVPVKPGCLTGVLERRRISLTTPGASGRAPAAKAPANPVKPLLDKLLPKPAGRGPGAGAAPAPPGSGTSPGVVSKLLDFLLGR